MYADVQMIHLVRGLRLLTWFRPFFFFSFTDWLNCCLLHVHSQHWAKWRTQWKRLTYLPLTGVLASAISCSWSTWLRTIRICRAKQAAEEPLGNSAALKCDIITSLCSLHLEEVQQGRIERRWSPSQASLWWRLFSPENREEGFFI